MVGDELPSANLLARFLGTLSFLPAELLERLPGLSYPPL
jgi:hypothetical protein